MSERNGYQDGPWEVCGLFADYPGIEGTKTSIIIFGYSEEKDIGVKGETKEQAIANARLIAAAPSLYEALKDLVDSMGCNAKLPYNVCEKARAALQRAEGEV